MKKIISLIFVLVLTIPILGMNTIYKIVSKTTQKIYVQDLKNNEDLQVYANKFVKEYFKIDKINIPIEFSYIEEDSEKELYIHGTFLTDENYEPKKIIINPYKYKSDKTLNDSHNIERILIHELIHYSLCYYGIEFADGTEIFEILNYALGGRSNDPQIKANLLDTKINSDCCS